MFMNDFLLNNLFFILALLFLLNILSISALLLIYAKFKKFTSGKDATSLENEILNIIETNKRILVDNKLIKEKIEDLIMKDKNNLKSASIVKFNPFSETGHGKQSFAAAVLSESGNGIVLSTLSLRGETHVFLKEVHHFEADALTDEEKEALNKAKLKLKLNNT